MILLKNLLKVKILSKLKKIYSFIFFNTELDESIVFDKPNIYCHFAGGIGEPKYMPITDWGILSRLLAEALAAYNDLVSAMNLVLFEDAMMHICR